MINIEEARKAFAEYVKPYDMSNEKIALRVEHIYRTVEVAKKIAEDLELSQEQILLAQLIALLHDIGRFEQIKIYNTFSDKHSIDHADFGVKILFEDGNIRKFVAETKYDDIIYKSIKNHNKFSIADALDEEELLQAKIIRDADKTDIFAVFVQDIKSGDNVLYNYEKVSKQRITPKVMQDFRNHKQTNRNDFTTDIDNYINTISFIFDYNYITGLKIIQQNKYIERVMKPICICEETLEQMNEIIEIANTYIKQRIEKGC